MNPKSLQSSLTKSRIIITSTSFSRKKNHRIIKGKIIIDHGNRFNDDNASKRYLHQEWLRLICPVESVPKISLISSLVLIEHRVLKISIVQRRDFREEHYKVYRLEIEILFKNFLQEIYPALNLFQ